MKALLSLGLAMSLAVGAVSAACAGETRLTDLAGVWQMRGYGKIFEISAQRMVTYDITDVSCVRENEEPIEKARQGYDRIVRAEKNFTAFASGGITRYSFDRLAALPDRCLDANARVLADPETNFAALWHAFRENYAFFDLRNTKWDEIYTKFRPRITPATPQDELFDIFSQVLAALNDGHVGLQAGEREFDSGGRGEMMDSWAAGQTLPDRREARERYLATVRSFVADDVLKGKGQRGAEDILTWGWAATQVGYINVVQMYMGSAENQMPLPKQIALVDDAMTRALADLRSAKALIVDARFNPGGYDAIALRIAGYFTRERREAFTKQAVFNDGYTEPQPVHFDPQGTRPFTGPIYFLQGGSSVSAAEIFALAMMALPHVTRVGTPTYGVLSDVLAKKLPNGWTVGLSNELYVAVDGNVYEGRGIPPHVTVPAAKAKSFHERMRLDVDTALALIQKKPVALPRSQRQLGRVDL